MRMYDLIQKKKEGKALSREEIYFFINGFTLDQIPDYQASALLMAICLKGMTEEETALLTEAMMHSGDTVDLSDFGNRSVDKHSTGGVGDKTTLIVAPIVAAAGGIVAKMSGRGLGFTGGTVDKMESIPGMKTDLSPEAFYRISHQVGMCVVGQTKGLAPADKKLYALRDVTATIDSIPLIASSVMSKKLAAGAKNIVLDVKFGSGAFMKTPQEAVCLAESMVKIGSRLGRKVRALVTDMDVPLGTRIGNALEVKEAVEILQGKGDEKLRQICLALATQMISLSKEISLEMASQVAKECLSGGRALEKMKEWVSSQGGDATLLTMPHGLPEAPFSYEILSPEEGYLAGMNTEGVGFSAMVLGAGRKTKEDLIDPGAGIVLRRKVGESVKKGEVLATLYTSRKQCLEEAEERFVSSLVFSSNPPEERDAIYCVVSE